MSYTSTYTDRSYCHHSLLIKQQSRLSLSNNFDLLIALYVNKVDLAKLVIYSWVDKFIIVSHFCTVYEVLTELKTLTKFIIQSGDWSCLPQDLVCFRMWRQLLKLFFALLFIFFNHLYFSLANIIKILAFDFKLRAIFLDLIAKIKHNL